MQTAAAGAVLDGVGREPEPAELPVVGHPVLPLGQRCEFDVGWTIGRAYSTRWIVHLRHAPIVARPDARQGTRV